MTKKPKTGLAAAGLLLAAGAITQGQEPTQVQLPAGPSQHVPLGPISQLKQLPPPSQVPAPVHIIPKTISASASTTEVRVSSPEPIRPALSTATVVPPPPPPPPPAAPQACDGKSAPVQPNCDTSSCAKKSWKLSIRASCGQREYFPSKPLGEAIGVNFQTQIDNGVAARMTLYDYDFVCGTDKLNYRGKDRVRQIACWLPQNDFPVMVERTIHTPELGDARRLAVLRELQEIGPIEPQRVVIGIPLAHPLNGVDAGIINSNLEQQTKDFGFPLYRNWYGTGAVGGVGVGNIIGGTNIFGGGSGGTSGR